MNQPLTLDNFIAVIRSNQKISETKIITEQTQLESELGITGDDGDELLIEIEKQFSLSFAEKDGTINTAFGLEADQYLFHSESFFLFTWVLALFGKKKRNIRPISVGQLYEVAKKVKNHEQNSRQFAN